MNRILRERVERSIAEMRQTVFKGPVAPSVELSWMLTEIAEAFIRLSPPGKQRSSPWSLAKAMVACRGEGTACGGRVELPFSTWRIHRYQREPFQIQIIAGLLRMKERLKRQIGTILWSPLVRTSRYFCKTVQL